MLTITGLTLLHLETFGKIETILRCNFGFVFLLGYLLLQVEFIEKNVKLSTHWHKTCYGILHSLAVRAAHSWLEDI